MSLYRFWSNCCFRVVGVIEYHVRLDYVMRSVLLLFE